jgi:hypothetical protein
VHDILNLLRKQQLDRRQLRHPDTQPCGCEERDPSATDTTGGFGER